MFGPIKNKRMFELVTEEIREVILSGSLKPGEKLPSERELSLQMKVGRSVIREALRFLELSGLVYIRQGASGGIFVKKPDATILTRSFSDLVRLGEINIDQLTEARLMIEKSVIQLVMKKNKTKEDYKPADDVIDSAFEKYEKGANFKIDNFAFHMVLAQLSRNPILIFMVNSIMPIFSRFVEKMEAPIEHCRKILESHKEILEEMKKGNISSANDKIEQHILFFAKEFRVLERSKNIKLDDIFSANCFETENLEPLEFSAKANN